jgi:uncharacterized membrane protein YozB (DUF420 family)
MKIRWRQSALLVGVMGTAFVSVFTAINFISPPPDHMDFWLVPKVMALIVVGIGLPFALLLENTGGDGS